MRTEKAFMLSRCYGLEKRPIAIVCQEERSHGSAAEAPTIGQQEDECFSERMPWFVTKLPNILLPVSKQKDPLIASELVDLLTDTSFEVNI